MFRRFQQLRLPGDVGPVSAELRPGFGSLGAHGMGGPTTSKLYFFASAFSVSDDLAFGAADLQVAIAP